MNPLIGEIRMFAGTFAPLGWALCHGQLLAIAENPALFAIIGTLYGGDGQQTFALPDLRGRMPMGMGAGPGLTARTQGETVGTETVTLGLAHLPAHRHTLQAVASPATSTAPTGALPAIAAEPRFGAGTANVAMGNTGATGGGVAVPNLPPQLGLHFIISLFGVFPQRN